MNKYITFVKKSIIIPLEQTNIQLEGDWMILVESYNTMIELLTTNEWLKDLMSEWFKDWIIDGLNVWLK